jgi:hypothetical protein
LIIQETHGGRHAQLGDVQGVRKPAIEGAVLLTVISEEATRKILYVATDGGK